LCLTACISIHAAAAGYFQGRLNNGLRYHILPTGEHNGRLAVQLQVEVGAADEENGEEGMAHMVEHMNFRSSPAYPQGIAAQLSARSWQMGRHFNAQTTYDYCISELPYHSNQPPAAARIRPRQTTVA